VRDIKFRAWYLTEERYYYFTLSEYANDYSIRYKVQNSDKELYTGLKDKTGKEIYEGDIVEFSKGIGQIIYSGGEYSIEYNNDLFNLGFHHHNNEIKIVGNIYENPELLKEKVM